MSKEDLVLKKKEMSKKIRGQISDETIKNCSVVYTNTLKTSKVNTVSNEKINKNFEDRITNIYGDLSKKFITLITKNVPQYVDYISFYNVVYMNLIVETLARQIKEDTVCVSEICKELQKIISDSEKIVKYSQNINYIKIENENVVQCRNDNIENFKVDLFYKNLQVITDILSNYYKNDICNSILKIINIDSKNIQSINNQVANDATINICKVLNATAIILDREMNRLVKERVNEKSISKSDLNIIVNESMNYVFNDSINTLSKLLSQQTMPEAILKYKSDVKTEIKKLTDLKTGEESSYATKKHFCTLISTIIEPINVMNNSNYVMSRWVAYFNEIFPGLIDGGMTLLIERLYSVITVKITSCILNDLSSKCETNIQKLFELAQKGSSKWQQEDYIECTKNCGVVNDVISSSYMNNQYLVNIVNNNIGGISEIITEVFKKFWPTRTKISNVYNITITECGKHFTDIFRKNVTDYIIVTEKLPKNEFSKDLDLTKLYTIPGMNSKQESTTEFVSDEKLWGDPENIGGCGCGYDYLLFLKEKFYKTIIPILVQDGIKTLEFSIHPIIENLNDPNYILHDKDIIIDQDKLQQHYFNKIRLDLSINKYLNRIDDLMTCLEVIGGFTVIVNFMDFSYDKYIWISGKDEKQYTHDMWVKNDPSEYFDSILRRLYYRADIQQKKFVRRNVKILLNVGKNKFTNKSDLKNEKYEIYPNCGYIRDLIMHIVYRMKITSNFMALPADKESNIYYYNPYTEFKSYSDKVEYILDENELTVDDYVDSKTNGEADVIVYDDKDSSIKSGYFKYYTSCHKNSYPISNMNDLMSWLDKKYDDEHTIKEHYTYLNNQIDANVMNKIFTPNARNAMRYMYLGHENYFKFREIIFNRTDGSVIEG